MKKKIGLLLATVMVMNTVSPMTFAAWKNPLANYNLYEDTHPTAATSSDSNERVMSDFYSNSMAAKNGGMGTGDIDPASFTEGGDHQAEETTKTRNETLRESSRNVYTDPETTPGWLTGPSFYPEPSFDSIVEKYRVGDYSGCLQESIAYVRLYPNDTLGFYYLAMSYSKVSDKDNAVMAYEKVIELNDNPMIVKYATNGRNCILGVETEACFENVNEPELIYPYAKMVESADLTPIDPEVLVNRNLAKLKATLSPLEVENEDNNDDNSQNKDKKNEHVLPFGKQDAELDAFINAPYGDGFSPELKKEYKQLQLRKIMDVVNATEDASDDQEVNIQENKNLKDIRKFDDKHSDSGMIKLAYAEPSKMFEELSKDPEYIRQKQEIEELQMLFGSEKSKAERNDMMDLLPYMSEQGDKKLSPEVIQSLMMQSMMGNLTL